MAAKSEKKWIYAVLLAVIFPALAIHVSCVAVAGPGNWGSGMEVKDPQWLPIEEGSPAANYIREFKSRQAAGSSEAAADSAAASTAPEFDSSVRGKPFWTDYLASEDLGVVATHEGASWVENQHIYLWRSQQESPDGSEAESGAESPQPRAGGAEDEPSVGQGIRELDLPSGAILERPALLRRGSDSFVVIGRWSPWAVSPLDKLSRYLHSYADPSLRPEHLLYVYRLPAGPLEYWGPGHTLKPSPDRRFAILLRSGALGAGYYSIHVWDFDRDQLATIVSLREAEPGSGRSFDYEWSRDSRAVHITGNTGGFERRRGEPRALDLIYLIGQEGLYDLQATVN
jgi:hypothetical protein